MPTILTVVLLVLILLLVLSCFYIASNMNKKLNRMRRRYDTLLRGHSDINLEEYVVGLSGELEEFKQQRAVTDRKIHNVEQWMARTDTDQSAHVDERFNILSHQLNDEMHQATGNLVTSMKRLDEQVYARMDEVEKGNQERLTLEISALRGQLNEFSQSISRTVKRNEEDAFVRFDALEKQQKQSQEEATAGFTRLSQEAQKGLKLLDSALSERMSGFQTLTQNRFQSVEQKTEEAITGARDEANAGLKQLEQSTTAAQRQLEQSTTAAQRQLEKTTTEAQRALEQKTGKEMEELRSRTEENITTMRNDLTERMKSENDKLKEQLSLAIQKIHLYRYNAFADVAGETSFSAVLLDEHKNGLILTSIYARQNTTTFAKEIRAGKPVQKLSPEEEKALAEAIRR